MSNTKHRGNRSVCLGLGPSVIGTKNSNMGSETFDNIVSNEFKNTEEAAYMLEETKKQLEKKYSTVYDGGSNQNMITVPAQYDFGVETKRGDKARAMQYGEECLIKARIAQLETLAKKKAEDEREKSHLEEILKEKLPLSCEADVVLRFRSFFENEPGLCLHSFKPTDYLIRFIELAKELRNDSSPLQLSNLERSILRVLNIEISTIDQWAFDIIAKIEIASLKTQPISNSSFSGQVIANVLDVNGKLDKARKSQFTELKNKFSIYKTEWDDQNKQHVAKVDSQGNKTECYYTRNEIIHQLYKTEYERLISCFNDEFDCLVFLARHRLIMGIEAKQAMTTNSDSNDKQAKGAAKQVKKREDYIKKTFGELLDNGWRYVRIVALYDHKGSIVQRKCPDCSPYILTDGTDKEQLKQMQNLMTSLGCNTGAGVAQAHSGQLDFKHVFSRLVGLSGLFMAVQKIGAYYNIMGTDATGINAGWTRASKLKFGNESDMSRLGDVVGRPSDIYNLVFFNQDQTGLLALKHKCVVFLDDYGAG